MANARPIPGSTPWGPLYCAIPAGPILDIYVAPGADNAADTNLGNNPLYPLATLGEFLRRASRLARMDASLRVHLESGVHLWTRGLQSIAMKAACFLAIIGDGAGQPGDDGKVTIVSPGVAAGGSSAIQVVTAGGMTVDALANYFIEILTGPAAGDIRLIRSNSATTIIPAGNFSAAVANTNTFRVFRPGAVLSLSSWPYTSVTAPSLETQGLIARDCGGPVGASGREFAASGVMLACIGVRGLEESSAFFGAQRSSLVCYGTQIAQVDDTGDIQIVGDPAARISCGIDAGFRDSFLSAQAPVDLGLADTPTQWLGYGLSARNPGPAAAGLPVTAGNLIGFFGASEYAVQITFTDVYWYGGGIINASGESALDVGPESFLTIGLADLPADTPRPLAHNKFNGAESGTMFVFGGGQVDAFRLEVLKTNQGIGVCALSTDEGQIGMLPGQIALKGGGANGVSVNGTTAASAPTLAIVACAGGVVTTLGNTGSGGPAQATGWPANSQLAVMFQFKSALAGNTVQKLDFADALVNFDGAVMPTPLINGPDAQLAGGRYGYIRLLG